MIEIDGSQGEGGGQIIRSSLALSAVTGQPVRFENIRAKRSKPGLMRQHLTAVKAAAEVCNAKVDGAEIGASSLTFEPSEIRAGKYHFQVGTAGSATLIAQTVLPALMLADGPSSLTVEGGTHNPWAPPFDFLQRAFLSQLAKLGPQVEAKIETMGFYPAGGGKFRLEVQPCRELRSFKLLERKGDMKPCVTAIISEIPASVGERECETIRRKSNWRSECFQVHEVQKPVGPGNVVMIELAWDNVTEVLIGFGKRGVKAEQVARKVYREAKAFIESEVPVGEYLADQLMMPMGLAAHQGVASKFRTRELSKHSETHLDILARFLDFQHCIEEDGDARIVSFQPAGA